MIIAILHTTEYRGTHADAVERVHRVGPGETVESLAARLFDRPKRGDETENDWIELKIATAAP